jgi:DNA polymerase-3 subunit epsilon/CBS domain-containing protein
MSLAAIGLDIEATGLDAQLARVVEISGLQVDSLEINSDTVFQHLINPGVPIPESASLIHGLTKDDLQGAPAFADVIEALDRFIGNKVVIGHNIGYDLSVIDHEFSRIGRSWKIPPSLDVRALARLAAPNLASYSLDTLCDWQEIEIGRRHRAFYDAHAAAQLFIKLVPLLRDCGVRTLAEAEAAVRDLPGEEHLHRVAGWISPVRAIAANNAPAIAAVDGYPFRHRVRDVIRRQPIMLEASASVAQAVASLSEQSPAGVVLVQSQGEPIGLVTVADFLRAQSLPEDKKPKTLADMKMQTLHRVADDDFLYRALARIQRPGVEYLCVESRRGEVIGLVSATDLLLHRTSAALAFGDEIETAKTVPGLGRAWAKVPAVAESLLREDLESVDVAGIIAAEICALTARAAAIAEERMMAEGKGKPPVPYVVMVLGSAGRGDSLLHADQDNAFVYAAGDQDGPEDRWFAEAGSHMCDVLNEVGIPYCTGGVMAKNTACRHSVGVWKETITGWIERAEDVDTLSSNIFFDGVPVHGELPLAGDVMDFAFTHAAEAPAFIAALSALARRWSPPINIFGRLRSEQDGRIDLKRNGLMPIFTLTRTFAIKHGIRTRSTMARLNEIKMRSLADPDMLDRAMTGFKFMMNAVLDQQVLDSRNGIPLSNRVDIKRMSALQNAELVRSMRAIDGLVNETLVR